MSLEIPKDTEKLIEAVLASDESIGNAPAYIHALVREDQLTRSGLKNLLESSASQLERLALEGLESGQPIDVNDRFWQDRRDRIQDTRE